MAAAGFGEGSVVSGLEPVRDSDRQGHGQPSVCPWLSAWRAPSAFFLLGPKQDQSTQKGETERSTPLLEDDPETHQAQ